MLDNNAAVAVDGGRDPNDGKGLGWDPYMESFILGCGGQITNYDKIAESRTPVVFRGITKAKHMRACEEQGRDYYYIDTGYFGNTRKKFFHRITKNAILKCVFCTCKHSNHFKSNKTTIQNTKSVANSFPMKFFLILKN